MRTGITHGGISVVGVKPHDTISKKNLVRVVVGLNLCDDGRQVGLCVIVARHWVQSG